MFDRWASRGGLGWINTLENLVGSGQPFALDNVADLRSIYRRLGEAIRKIDGRPLPEADAPDEPLDEPPKRAVRRY